MHEMTCLGHRSPRTRPLASAAVAALLTLVAACSGRSCGLVPVDHAKDVADLAKRRGVNLSVTSCRDASEGNSMMAGRFSCLAQLDPGQKQHVIDAFGLTKRAVPLGYYTPTQTYRCGSRIDLPYNQERSEGWRADVWAAEGNPSATPGFESVELHVAPSGEACIELVSQQR